MTSAKTATFDEAAYREDLVRAGLDPLMRERKVV
jgi:hypothetical protein